MNRALFVILFTLFFSQIAWGQYQGDRPQAKSFEYSELLFSPSMLDPYGAGGFSRVFPGLMDDQLSDMTLNPALLAGDPDAGSLLYLDFRNARELETPGQFGMAHYRYGMPGIGYWRPWYQPQSREALEPLLSAAIAGRPFGNLLPRLRAGVDYQMIFNHQDYYPVPQDIYRFVAGVGLDGARMAGTEDMDVRDRFAGSDEMMLEGHLAGLNLAYDLRPITIGMRLAYTSFRQDGSQGTSNLWQNTMDHSSFWSTSEMRSQDYHHWDVSAGLAWVSNESLQTGFRLGWLSGSADQQAGREDASERLSGTVGEGDSWSFYVSDHVRDQHWDFSGPTWYGNWHLKSRLADDLTLMSHVRMQRQHQDIVMYSSINEASEGSSRWTWSQNQRDSFNESHLMDERNGTGDRTVNQAALQVSLLWQLNEVSRFSIGAGFQRRILTTETSEMVFAESYYLREWESTNGTNDYHSVYELEEEKEIVWNFDANTRTLYFPVWYQRTFSPMFEGMIGLNRSMAINRIEDETLILYAYKEEYDGTRREREENFGERVRLPDVKESDLRYDLLAALTVRPAERLQVRFLMVPGIERMEAETRINTFQFWMSMQMTL